MAPRRSRRIATVVSAAAPQHADVELRNLRKRKASNEGVDERKTSKERKKAPIKGTKNSKANDQTRSVPPGNDGLQLGQTAPEDALSVLPAEIQQKILANINDAKSMVNLASTSKRYYALTMAVVHNHIAVKVGFFAHIPNVIRLLEPHLSIAQKKQLKKEARYKGQQDRFSSRLDLDAVPGCAQYVRQMTIGGIDPGKKHKKVVVRTLEEVLKNLSNLEVLDTTVLTDSMAHSIVTLKNLKALRIWNLSCCERDRENDDAEPLSQLHSLRHLSIKSVCSCLISSGRDKSLHTILRNSCSTLESLDLNSTRWYSSFLTDRKDQSQAHNSDTMNQPFSFPALKSLKLCRPSWVHDNGTCLSSIASAVNFLQLRELELMRLKDGKLTFFKSLEDLFSKADTGAIQLRKLTLDMDAEQPNLETSEVHMEGIYRFIASFDTLTSLEFRSHNTFNDNLFNNPGLSRRLLQVILKHKDLESLRFGYTTNNSPSFSVEAVRVLTKNLPRLRVFEFPPEEKDFDGMARSVSHAKSLETLICSSFNSWNNRVKDSLIIFRDKMMESLLHSAGDNEDFVWENVYNLKQITTGYREFAIGSDLKPTEDKTPPVRITKDGRSVWVQDTRIIEETKKWYYTAPSQWASHIMTSTL